jgi:hypothetical protein
MIKIRIAMPEQVDSLLDADAYQEFLAEQG